MYRGKIVGRALQRAKVLFEGALLDDEIQARLAPYGYSRERLLKLKAMLRRARELAAKRQAELAAKLEARRYVEQNLAARDCDFAIAREQARQALRRDRPARKALGLEDPRGRTIADLIHQMEMFYINALEHAESLAPFGLSRERIERELHAVQELEAAHSAQQSAKGAAMSATKERNQLMSDLKAHTRALEFTAKKALKNRRDLLVRLGLGRKQSAGKQAAVVADTQADVVHAAADSAASGVIGASHDAGAALQSVQGDAQEHAVLPEAKPNGLRNAETSAQSGMEAAGASDEALMREKSGTARGFAIERAWIAARPVANIRGVLRELQGDGSVRLFWLGRRDWPVSAGRGARRE